MIYALEYIDNHPSYRIHEGVSYFINEMERMDSFDESIFDASYIEIKDALSASPKFKELLVALYDAYKTVAVERERKKIIEAFNYWNNIDSICQKCDGKFFVWDDLRKGVGKKIKNLFEYLYKELTKTSAQLKSKNMLREQHYAEFWKKNGKVCCCCGIDVLSDPVIKLNAYDHYLHITKYPYCGINYRNIIPVCDDCNESPSKGSKHVLFENYSERKRRLAYFPYEQINSPKIQIEIDKIFPGDCSINLQIKGDSIEKTNTWMQIFNIVNRYKSIINTEKERWITTFVKNDRIIINGILELKKEIKEHIKEIQESSRYVHQHLEISFWESVTSNDVELDLLLDYTNEKRFNKYGSK